MIDSVVNFALDNLSRLLVSEVTLLSSVKDQIRSLNDELKFMNIFIKSSEGKREDPFVKEVVNQIRNVAYQAEDVVDTYVVNVNNQRSRNMLGKFFHSKDHVMMFHEVSDQINSIKRRIDEIYQNKSKYGIQQGLPLAIIVLAGMVAKKERSPREWLKIKNNVSWYLVQEEEYRIVTNILKLSYDDLPQTLKPCFLYLGVYPEDYEINVRRLCQLWIAEGFIQKKEVGPSNSPEVEDIADMYLDKLVERSLVQVASRRTDGGVKTCRVHDLLRDLCISESRENKFMEVCTNLDAIKCNSRRMSLQYRGELRLTEDNQSSARSLLLFGENTYWENESEGWKQIKNGFKLARVLDMNQVRLCLSPRGLTTLIHLRFLKVTASSRTIGDEVLASICNLWNLETLYLWIKHSITLPNKIWKLKSLRHVYLNCDDIFRELTQIESIMQRMKMEEATKIFKGWSGGASMSKMKIGETKVENLQTLHNICLNARTASVLKKGMFPNLTKLTLRGEVTELPEAPEKEFLENSLQCLNKLRTLKLLGIAILPLDRNAYPTSLTKITISFGQLDARIIKTLGQLANLQILKLGGRGIYGDVDCVAGDFPQLRVLQCGADMVDGRWKVEKGAMPQIRYCNIPHIRD
ncbi:hypothetical protein AHAS_Ahas14G0271900 [Arachis hypogaea]